MNPQNCTTVIIFGPHVKPYCAPPAPWWHLDSITPANLGWWILGVLAAYALACKLINWVDDRWEITPCAPWRYRIARRWYGTHSQVRLRAEAGADDPPRYVVLEWDGKVPWLKVQRLDPEYLTYWDECAEPFWAPVTVFAPYAVRRFRPGVTVIRRIPVPWLWKYPVLPLTEADDRTPEEINTAYYINMASWKQPYDPPGTGAALLRGDHWSQR